VASSFAPSTVVIGALIGGEGLIALALPVLVGSWSDRLVTPIGGRLPFVLGATPMLALALGLLGFVNSIGAAAFGLAIFFAGYFVAYEPYRALYPDLVDEEVAGRAQSTQAMSRGLATVTALAAGGVLLSIGTPVPFVASAAVVAVSVGAFGWVVARRGVREPERREQTGARALVGKLLVLLREHGELRAFLAANALWELSLGALKTFVILYVTNSLGMSTSGASLVVGAVAVVVLLASPVSGKLGDRVGRAKVMTWSLVVYGIGLLAPFFTTSTALLVPVLPIVAFGGGVIMTLPYALLMPMMPSDEHGTLTGFYSVSRGIGVALGPALAGLAIQIAGQDYRAMWLVCGAAILASIPFTRRLRAEDEDAGR
jgi:MFS family permease